MPFTFTNYQPGTPEQVNPFHAALQGALRNYQNTIRTAYLPQQIQADIFSKKFLPLAQIASSPLAQGMLPDQSGMIRDAITQLLQQSGVGGGQGSMFGGGGMNPSPSMGGIGGQPQMGMGGSSPQNAGGTDEMPPPNQNPLLPHGGLGTRAGEKALAPYNEQKYSHGVVYGTEEGDTVSPTGQQVDQAERTMTAYNNLKDIVPALLEQSKEFENKSSDIKRAHVAQLLKSHHLGPVGDFISSDPDMAGRWRNFNQVINRAGIVLQGIYPASQSQESYNQHMAMLSFDPNVDTYKTYSAKIKKLLADSRKAFKNAQLQAGGGKGGYNLEKPPEEESMEEPMPKTKTINGVRFEMQNGKWVYS